MARRAMRRPPSLTARRLLLALTLTLALAAVFTLLLASAAPAHIPRPTERGAALETAIVVEEPAVSWVNYGVIEQPGDAWSYRMDFEAGDRIYLQVIGPSQTDPPPSLALMGPGLSMPAVISWQRRVVSAVPSVAGLVLLGGFVIGSLPALAAAAAPPWRRVGTL